MFMLHFRSLVLLRFTYEIITDKGLEVDALTRLIGQRPGEFLPHAFDLVFLHEFTRSLRVLASMCHTQQKKRSIEFAGSFCSPSMCAGGCGACAERAAHAAALLDGGGHVWGPPAPPRATVEGNSLSNSISGRLARRPYIECHKSMYSAAPCKAPQYVGRLAN